MAARTSLTPAATADTSTKRRSVALETIDAIVVLPVPGGPHSSSEDVGWSGALDQPAQRRARRQQVLLPDELVEGARPHPHRQRAGGRVLLLALFGGGGEQVGLHARNPMSPH